MPKSESPFPPTGTSIETIESVVEAMVESLKEFDRRLHKDEEHFDDRVTNKLLKEKTARTALSEFREWLPDGLEVESLAEIKSTRGNVSEPVVRAAAWDALQVVVLAYLPGSRYFQGAYIYSLIHDSGDLKSIKSAFRVPHLSGTVGWMTTHLLAAKDTPYVVLADAQLDLRGRVAVPDLHLGNRAVLGFPVSLNEKNTELASISGFVFFSHPVPGVFPDTKSSLGECFAETRKRHETALAGAIESYIFRRSGKSVLSQQQNLKPSRTPLLALSDNDPTGYLVSILFESDENLNLASELEINEGVFLETTTSLLRVASIYPDKWPPRFVQHMRRLGKLIEDEKFYQRLPMFWFSRGDVQMVTPYYPDEYKNDVEVCPSDLMAPTGVVSITQRGIEGALANIMALFGARTGASRQADLVVPIVCEEGDTTHAMGFFRINCDASTVPDDKVKRVFQSLWYLIKEIQDDLNPEAAQLFLALETRLTDALRHSCQQSANHNEVRHFKLCADTVNILSDWLVRQVHRLLLQRINPDAAFLSESERVQEEESLQQQQKLIRIGLGVIACSEGSLEQSQNGDLARRFDHCSSKFEALFEQTVRAKQEPMPEVTFVSFWPRLRLPTLKAIDYIREETGESAEEVFSELLVRDPGLSRMLSIIAPMLDANQSVSLGGDTQGLPGWHDVHFGVPTNSEITTFEVTRPSRVDGLVLDVKWKDTQTHRVRLTWNWDETLGPSRELGGHSLSNTPWVVAHRLGENILTDLKMSMPPELQDLLHNAGLIDGRLLDYVTSSDRDALEKQFDHLERAMLYDDSGAVSWRLLSVPTNSHSSVFLAALYNKRIKRPSVLAFRDFALANARAFYVAREYEAQKQAADEYTRNLSAISHGYRGPVRQLLFSVSRAKQILYTQERHDPEFTSTEMRKLEDMAKWTKELANDAIHYARRKTDTRPFAILEWDKVCAEIKGVVQAFNIPWAPDVDFTTTDPDTELRFKIVLEYWRHLLAKTIDNGITHGDENPDKEKTQKVFIKAEVDPRRFVLKINTFLVRENLKSDVARVRRGLIDGQPNPKKASAHGKDENHGFGLMEVRNCCDLLGIEPAVEVGAKDSMLIVSFDGSSMIHGSK